MKKLTPLMAIAMAGILAPEAKATVYNETNDFPNGSSPTVWGAFNPLTDGIRGSLSNSLDSSDAILFSGTGGASVTIPFTFNYTGGAGQYIYIGIYDNAGFGGNFFNAAFSGVASGSTNITFTVPADGNYMFNIGNEGGSYNYTLGAVPEPGTMGLMAAGAVGAMALARRRKAKAPKQP